MHPQYLITSLHALKPKTDLKRLLSSVYKLVTFELGALNKRLATLRTDVDTWAVSVQMLTHCGVVPKQLAAALHHQPTSKLNVGNTALTNIYYVYLLQLALCSPNTLKEISG